MIDIHTHILPKMDDGSKSAEMSVEMLRLQKEQGVDTVVLTPHFYRNKEEPNSFFRRRETSFQMLRTEIAKQNADVPELILGAEVAWMPNMDEWEELSRFCIGDTEYLLLEMPFYPWNSQMLQQIYSLIDLGITPIFAHLERYLKDQKKEYIQEILDMGTPIQVSSAPMAHFMERRPILQMLKKGQAHIMASDCHNLTTRPPNLAAGLSVVEKKLGSDVSEQLKRNVQELYLTAVGDSNG